MTNEEIIDTTRGTELWQYYGEEINKLLNLARQDEREKCLKILAGKMFELQFMFNKVYEKTYQDRETLTLPELQQRIADIADVMQRIRSKSERQDEREKMQGVDVWVSWDKHKRQEVYPVLTFTEPAKESRPSYFTYYKTDDESYATITPKEAKSLGVSEGQCKKFRIVEELP